MLQRMKCGSRSRNTLHKVQIGPRARAPVGRGDTDASKARVGVWRERPVRVSSFWETNTPLSLQRENTTDASNASDERRGSASSASTGGATSTMAAPAAGAIGAGGFSFGAASPQVDATPGARTAASHGILTFEF